MFFKTEVFEFSDITHWHKTENYFWGDIYCGNSFRVCGNFVELNFTGSLSCYLSTQGVF